MARVLAACGVALLLLACSAPRQGPSTGVPADPLDHLAWLAGSWLAIEGNNRSEEHWTAPAGGTMLGMNRTISNGRTAFFEFLRIEARDDGIFYLASPKGRQPPTPFKLIESSAQRVVFENLEHDFPQRIIYERRGDELSAAIEGTQNGKPRREQWTWRRAPTP